MAKSIQVGMALASGVKGKAKYANAIFSHFSLDGLVSESVPPEELPKEAEKVLRTTEEVHAAVDVAKGCRNEFGDAWGPAEIVSRTDQKTLERNVDFSDGEQFFTGLVFTNGEWAWPIAGRTVFGNWGPWWKYGVGRTQTEREPEKDWRQPGAPPGGGRMGIGWFRNGQWGAYSADHQLKVVCQEQTFVYAENSNNCPSGYANVWSEATCREFASKHGLSDFTAPSHREPHDAMNIRPRGCYRLNDGVYINELFHPQRPSGSAICRKITSESPAEPMPLDVCIQHNFVVELGRRNGVICNYDSLVDRMQQILDGDDVENCNHDVHEELALHLGVQGLEDARERANALCAEAWTQYSEAWLVKWKWVSKKGKPFDQSFFEGGSVWNTEVETSHYGETQHRLKDEAQRVEDTYDTTASDSVFEYPTWIAPLANCEHRAVTCCEASDRQANDNNGNCATPYDTNCVNKYPADNTEVCDSEHAPRMQGDSWYAAQQPIHCHGFAWANDTADASHVFRGNNLFYVGLYDHFLQRGYVKNLPGVPMCGCVEKMPKMTRSDCTQIDLETSFRFRPSTIGASIEQIKIDIDFNACQGANNQNNDLYAYFQRLVEEGKATTEELAGLRTHLVGNNNCPP